MKTTSYNGFPVVISKESQYLVGFVERRDLILSISQFVCCGAVHPVELPPSIDLSNFPADNAKDKHSMEPSARVYFTPQYPANVRSSTSSQNLKLRKIVDLVSSRLVTRIPVLRIVAKLLESCFSYGTAPYSNIGTRDVRYGKLCPNKFVNIGNH